MKKCFYVFCFLMSAIMVGQSLKTKKVKEKVKGFEKTKREYSVLSENPTVKHGAYYEYYKKNLVVSGAYKNGLKDGNWLYESPEKSYKQMVSFKQGKPVGTWKRYIDNKLIFEALYSDDFNLQESKSFDIDGSCIYESSYDRTKNITNVKEVSRSGFIMKYNTSKHSSKHNKGEFHGVHKVMYPNGILLQEKKYNKGKLVWASDIFNKDGSVYKKTILENGNGVLHTYYLNKIAKGEFVAREVFTYKDSVPNGVKSEYNDSGKLIAQGIQYKNKKKGLWKVWSNRLDRYVEKDYKIKSKSMDYILGVPSVQTEDVPFAVIQNSCIPMEEEGNTTKGAKKVFSNLMNSYVSQNLDTDLVANLSNPNSKKTILYRAVAIFKINTLGEISDIRVKSPNAILEREFKKVLEEMPRLIPASQNGKTVNLLFSLPLTFKVSAQKKKDPFESLQEPKQRF